MLIPSKSETLRRLDRLIHSSVSFEREFERFYGRSLQEKVATLSRKGWVEIRETPTGTEVKITDWGKTEVLKYQIEELKIAPMTKWDGKWRMVFFDVAETSRSKRNQFRLYLLRLGFKAMQWSVYVHPFPCEKEIKFLREVLGVPHGVKLVTAEKIENDAELRKIFAL